MTIDTLLKNPDIYILFDGCPTCKPDTLQYLNECRTRAQLTHRQLHIVQSGSQTATLMRTIAKNQKQPIKYPMMLMDSIIRYNPQDITTTNERTTQ